MALNPTGQSKTSKTTSPKFDAMDRLTIVFLALLLISSTVGFFLYVRWHGLLTFADSGTYSQDRYFLEALQLRESYD